jgi:hypothetical protein
MSPVIPSEVEGSRGITLRATRRDPSTPLRSAQDDGKEWRSARDDNGEARPARKKASTTAQSKIENRKSKIR